MIKLGNRSSIPAGLRRKVLLEAGHRCAIPTCRFPTTEIAHIEPYSVVQKHEYHNLIALCPNCHTRFDHGEIDRKSMLAYKRKIAFLSDRYSKFELNVLNYLRNNRAAVVFGYLTVKNLIDEGLIEQFDTICSYTDDRLELDCDTEIIVILTETGEKFLKEWDDAQSTALTYFD